MTTIVSASDSPAQVLISEAGAKGDTGAKGANGTGLNNIRYSELSNPLFSAFKKNKLASSSAPSGTDADIPTIRPSIATYTDRYGVIQTSATNEIREEESGYLIESASTNLLLHSIDASNAAWVKTGVTVNSDVTASCIDGELADRITNTAGGSAEHLSQTVAFTDSGQDITISFLITKDTVNTTTLRLIMSGGTTIDKTATFDYTTETFTAVSSGLTARLVKKLSNGFYWVSATHTANGTNTALQPRLYSDSVGSWFFAGSQIEELPFASSLIVTTASSVTRSGDDVRIQVIDNTPSLGEAFAISVDVNNIDHSIGSALRYYFKIPVNEIATSSEGFILVKQASGNILLRYSDSPSNRADITLITGDSNGILVISSDGATLSMYFKGVLVGAGDISGINISNKLGDEVSIGGLIADSVNKADTNMGGLRFYDSSLNADEVQLISGA